MAEQTERTPPSDVPATGSDDETRPMVPVTSRNAAGTSGEHDPGRYVRTWFWLVLAAGFGLFLVFGSVQAHYWRAGRPIRRGIGVLDVWREQVNGLPDVAHESILKSVFLMSVFGFIGLAVVALWFASVEVRPNVPTDDQSERKENPAPSTPRTVAG